MPRKRDPGVLDLVGEIGRGRPLADEQGRSGSATLWNTKGSSIAWHAPPNARDCLSFASE